MQNKQIIQLAVQMSVKVYKSNNQCSSNNPVK